MTAMTVGEWEERAEACRMAGDRLVITPAEYASLVRLRLANDVLDIADHSLDLFRVPLVVRGGCTVAWPEG